MPARPTGPDELQIVSVGTGSAAERRPDLKGEDFWLLDHAKNIPGALMNSASAGWDMACRTLGRCRYGASIDREFGDLVVSEGGSGHFTGGKQFSYVRHDPDVSQPGLDALGLAHVRAEDVQLMDSVEHIASIQEVGRTYAERTVSMAHLAPLV